MIQSRPSADLLTLPPDVASDPAALIAICEGGLTVTAGLDTPEALGRIVESAHRLTGAQYTACGMASGEGFQHFLYRGVGPEVAQQIGHLPLGRGLLGHMLTRRDPLRLDDLGRHAQAEGFPPGHPPMQQFLGVPIRYQEETIGVIYLCDKRDGTPFTARDEALVVVLARFAAIALANAFQHSEVNQALRRQSTQLDETNRTLRALSNRVLWMMESERRLLAQELHDDLGQMLSAAVLAADHIAEGRGDTRQTAQHLRSMLRDAIQAVRRISHGLRPSILDELGPVPAIQASVAQIQATRRDWVTFTASGDRRRLPEPLETVLYRVAQEALTNAIRHSGAGHIDLTLAYEPARVVLAVTDDGIGLDLHRAEGGLGVAGMRERATLIGASLEIRSTPGQGTTVQLTVPL